MKKMLSIIMSSILVISVLLQTQVQAAAPIGVYINGVKLTSDQDPILVSGRALLPLRAIFEALDASVDWNQQTKVVTATKDGKTIVLKLGVKTATINNTTVSLDVPAQNIKGRVLVPVRFVSEALGEVVDWNSSTQKVTITTTTKVNPVSYINTKVVGQTGDGRDLQVSFSKATMESGVNEYRVFVVKSALSSTFNLATALSNKNYTSVPVQGKDITVTLASQAKDVSGELIRANQSYVVYVLTVGKGSVSSVLSNASSTVNISNSSSVAAVTNMVASDASDYGDGRDMLVSFNKVADESKLGSYRILVVKSNDAGNFNLTKANAVSSSNYTTVNKKGTNISQVLASSARDVDGATIRNGVNYRVFVLSVGTGSSAGKNALSSYSSMITLAVNTDVNAVTNIGVTDVSDYGDGRDLRVTFNRVSNESNINHYRIMVVKSGNAGNFNLSSANAVSSSNYTYVSKTGSSISQVLSSGARDVDGTTIRNGTNYRVFVLSVGTGSYANTNALSSYSYEIKLDSNSNVNAVTGIGVSDVSDYNDGRDLRVSFDRANDESNISHYRIMVVKSGNAGSFGLSSANAVSSSNYTYVSKTGYNNLSQVLASNARDVNGDLIRNGVSYRVFVLSVGTGNYANTNALSSYSNEVTLSGALVAVAPVTGVSAVQNVEGSGWTVSFTKPGIESNIDFYEVMIVPSARGLTLADANSYSVTSAVYKVIYKADPTNVVINIDSKDVTGAKLQAGQEYSVYILSRANGANANALSNQPGIIRFP
ncbi:stalk domain-containing protein [Paenibacillus sp. FA6]|uniref:stalk domain-containing protein n=1 Tax=Paenibacillus sp. FA6 TaxID=3413029 RepID=UPI003F65FE62